METGPSRGGDRLGGGADGFDAVGPQFENIPQVFPSILVVVHHQNVANVVLCAVPHPVFSTQSQRRRCIVVAWASAHVCGRRGLMPTLLRPAIPSPCSGSGLNDSLANQPLDGAQELCHVERFITDGVSPAFECLLDQLLHFAAMAGDQDCAGIRVLFPCPAHYLTTITLGQLDVNDRYVHRAASGEFNAKPPNREKHPGQANPIAPLAKQVPQGIAKIVVVVYHKDQRLFSASLTRGSNCENSTGLATIFQAPAAITERAVSLVA